MLKVSDLSLSYKKKNVIKNASFEVDYGMVVGLLGANGTGKSTLLSAIAGVKKPDSGEITLDNLSLSNDLNEYKKMFGYATQENPLIDELSGIDNLKIWTSLNTEGIMSTISTPPLSILGVASFAHVRVNSMSGGMKKRLSLTSILINNPKVLLMDEPFSALDMVARYDIMTYINTFKQSGGIVIIASHEDTILKACDKVLFIDNGIVKPIQETGNVSYIDILRSSLTHEG
ncbi:MAG: ATP-binding cassette domain-containing protein [Eubacterium sp.]|nr:ATP-binding cassette domain-containing protein [Eubacterium sp.]